ncbi:hypothetical protein HY993_01920 [Candidatus Micrarchaeota archaeon]|nr:hypothetical protein [Candidatus Micrarchaeota archaeon]
MNKFNASRGEKKKMRRGILGLSIAVLALLILVQIKGVEGEFAQKKHSIILSQIELEKAAQAKNDVESAYKQVLEKTKGRTVPEQVAKTAANLFALQGVLEKEYAGEGVEISLWFGATDEEELTRLQQNMLDENKAIKCKNCFDYAQNTTGYEKDSVPLVTAFLNPKNGKMRVSRNGWGLVKSDARITAVNSGNKLGLGCSLYANSTSANCFVGEEIE